MKRTILITVIAVLSSVSFTISQDMSQGGDKPEIAPMPKDPRIDSYYLQNSLFDINYLVSFPLGDLHDYIHDPCLTGFEVNFKSFLTDQLAVGGNVGVLSFYEKFEHDTYVFENGALTATIFNYYYTIPLHVTGAWFFNPSWFIQPYAGLGIGINYNERRTEIGFFVREDNSWNFAVSPEAGAIVPFKKYSKWGLLVKARYNYQVYNRERFNGMQNFDLGLGLSYSY